MTHGCEPATSCVATRTASTRSSIASATLFAGRAKTSRRSKSRPFSARARASRRRSSTGSAVPGADGRAGMALLKIDGQFDLDTLARRLETLPRYARPLFLRLAREIETTETFKPKRRIYVEQGFDPGARGRSALRLRTRATGLCPARCELPRSDPKRRHASLTAE